MRTVDHMGTRIFLAGASGVIGSRLIPLLVDAGHTVGAMTRWETKASRLAALGAEPIVCDVFDRPALTTVMHRFSPDVLLHELTDLPDDLVNLPKISLLNARIRAEGTRNLLDALEDVSRTKVVAQSVAWTMPPGAEADAIASLEAAVLAASGVVLRYGFLYGPGTYFPDELPPAPRVQIDIAAAQTVAALDAPTGVLTIVE
jgi:nucleoside-diphosphate-sugar epimerase